MRAPLISLLLVVAACASSPSPSSPPPASPPPAATTPPPTGVTTPPPTGARPDISLYCERDEDCTTFDDCGECKPMSVNVRLAPAACSEVHGPGCANEIPHCNVQTHTCELHHIEVES